jgi:hypothetical protein
MSSASAVMSMNKFNNIQVIQDLVANVFKVTYKFDVLGHQARFKRWIIDLICNVTAYDSQKI